MKSAFPGLGVPIRAPKPREWQMAISAFFDESGKFKDHEFISFGGVVSDESHFQDFNREWGRLLFLNGLTALSAKRVLRHHVPLSDKSPSLGIRKRINTLLPFIGCIRKHLQVVIGLVIDVRAFKKLPPHFYQYYGADPAFMAFVRVIIEVAKFAPTRDLISLVCDEDEQTSLEFYKLYKQVKRKLPRVRRKLSAISFADDKVYCALQAADFVASLIRQETTHKLRKTKFECGRLFKALTKPPELREKLWQVYTALGDKPTLVSIAESLREEWKKIQEDAQAQQRV